MTEGTAPVFTLSEPERLGAFSVLMPAVMDVLQSYHPETAISGDDILDFLCLSIAALHDNDTHIKTLRHRRLALATSASHIDRWMKRLREARAEPGTPSLLETVLDEDRRRRGTH
jgi:hypothetical protein